MQATLTTMHDRAEIKADIFFHFPLTPQSTHKNLLEALNGLVVPPSSQMVQASAECCLRPAKDNHSIRYVDGCTAKRIPKYAG